MRPLSATSAFSRSGAAAGRKAAVLPAELARAFVSDRKRGLCGIEPLHQHQNVSMLQPELLLVLERAHRGQRPEVMVKR